MRQKYNVPVLIQAVTLTLNSISLYQYTDIYIFL